MKRGRNALEKGLLTTVVILGLIVAGIITYILITFG